MEDHDKTSTKSFSPRNLKYMRVRSGVAEAENRVAACCTMKASQTPSLYSRDQYGEKISKLPGGFKREKIWSETA
jgi:hypothetical protein